MGKNWVLVEDHDLRRRDILDHQAGMFIDGLGSEDLSAVFSRTKLVVSSDLEALRWIMTIVKLNGRIYRWRLGIQSFEFTLVYMPGVVYQVPEVL